MEGLRGGFLLVFEKFGFFFTTLRLGCFCIALLSFTGWGPAWSPSRDQTGREEKRRILLRKIAGCFVYTYVLYSTVLASQVYHTLALYAKRVARYEINSCVESSAQVVKNHLWT
jgi:hypothetical protein